MGECEPPTRPIVRGLVLKVQLRTRLALSQSPFGRGRCSLSNAEAAEPPRVIASRKPGGGVRWLTHLGARDGLDYARAVARVARAVERALGPEVLANRALRDGLSLVPWRAERARFRSIVGRWVTSGRSVLATDVAECYRSIDPGVVERALRRLRCDPGEIVELLDRFARAGVPGLPIGPDASAILANAVLEPADRAVRRTDTRFVRWVDDYVLEGSASARALDALGEELGRIGLSLHAAKTRRLEPRRATEPAEAPAPQGFSQGRLA